MSDVKMYSLMGQRPLNSQQRIMRSNTKFIANIPSGPRNMLTDRIKSANFSD
jgi:hypothetical protein